MKRIVLRGNAAKLFYNNATHPIPNDEPKFTGFGKDYEGIGGFYYSKEDKCYIAFDFTNGDEVFLEEFDSEIQAEKYASGIKARTRQGVEI